MKRLLLACTLLGAPTAIAQDEDRITACEAEADLEQRIACLEAGLRGEPWPPEAAPSVDAAVEPAEPAAPAQAEAQTAQPGSPPPEQTAAALGQEQVEARSRSRAQDEADEVRYTMNVTSFRTVYYQRLELTMENGQVWRQISGDSQSVRIPGRKADNLQAEVWESRLGGYKLRLPAINRTIRVERVR